MGKAIKRRCCCRPDTCRHNVAKSRESTAESSCGCRPVEEPVTVLDGATAPSGFQQVRTNLSRFEVKTR